MSAKKRILVVDDDKDLVDLTRGVLETAGYEVLSAYDGASGLALAKAERPDLLLLDVMMASDTEGFDISRDLQSVPELAGLKVIILTGLVEAKKLGFHFEPDETWLPVAAVLEKPVPPAELLRQIEQCFSGKVEERQS